jgi:hypothetical protein
MCTKLMGFRYGHFRPSLTEATDNDKHSSLLYYGINYISFKVQAKGNNYKTSYNNLTILST